MLSNILTIACGLGLAYVFLIIIETIRIMTLQKIRRPKHKNQNTKTVYNYENKQVKQPVKEDNWKK